MFVFLLFLHLNLTQMQNDELPFYLGEQYWKNPDEFNPERFTNDQNEIITPEAFIPFGYGNKPSFFMIFKWFRVKYNAYNLIFQID
jgi:hypothetical protein